MLKKVFALVLCLVLVFGTGVVASAESVTSESAESQVQPRYSYTNIISATCTKSGSNVLCIGDVSGYNGTTTKIVMTVTLQKKTVLWWSRVEQWTITVNNYYATISELVPADSGKTYRVKVEADVYSGSNYETVDCISETQKF